MSKRIIKLTERDLTQIIKRVLRNLISAYEKQSNMAKAEEITSLLTMLLEIEPDKN